MDMKLGFLPYKSNIVSDGKLGRVLGVGVRPLLYVFSDLVGLIMVLHNCVYGLSLESQFHICSKPSYIQRIDCKSSDRLDSERLCLRARLITCQ